MSLSHDLAPHTSSHKGITNDVLACADPPSAFNDSYEFEVGEQFNTAGELDMSITSKVEHHDALEHISQESCVEVIEPIKLEFNDTILSMEYESLSYGFNVNVSLDVDLCVEYVSFSFEPIQTDLIFENCKSELVESENIVTKSFALDQTHTHIGLNKLVDFAPTILPRVLLARPMTYLLANYV